MWTLRSVSAAAPPADVGRHGCCSGVDGFSEDPTTTRGLYGAPVGRCPERRNLPATQVPPFRFGTRACLDAPSPAQRCSRSTAPAGTPTPAAARVHPCTPRPAPHRPPAGGTAATSSVAATVLSSFFANRRTNRCVHLLDKPCWALASDGRHALDHIRTPGPSALPAVEPLAARSRLTTTLPTSAPGQAARSGPAQAPLSLRPLSRAPLAQPVLTYRKRSVYVAEPVAALIGPLRLLQQRTQRHRPPSSGAPPLRPR